AVFLSPFSDDGSESEASVSNKFVNDGSFLQQFLKLQREKSNAESAPNAPNNTGNAPAPNPGKKPALLGKRPGQALSRMLQARSLCQPKPSPVLSRLSVFQGPDEEEEEDYEQWLEIKEDSETRQVVEKLARFVAEGGPELEKVAMEDYKDNPAFGFLHDKNSREFLYYRKKVAEIRKENQNSQAASSQKVSPPADQETRNSAEKLAQFVAAGGPEVEAIALQNNRENPAFRFLYEPHSRGHRYYRQKLEEFRRARAAPGGSPFPGNSPFPSGESGLKRKSSPEASPSPLCFPPLPVPSPLPLPIPVLPPLPLPVPSPVVPAALPVPSASPAPSSSSTSPPDQLAPSPAPVPNPAVTPNPAAIPNLATTPNPSVTPNPAPGSTKKKRKSRWGPEEEKVELPLPQLVQQLDSPSPLSGEWDWLFLGISWLQTHFLFPGSSFLLSIPFFPLWFYFPFAP
ncbi:SURP and G-patch domain-containing protein 1, partial [Serinus canaria]|uniref:SURP and G-patch domain-containing protein 1 n=1 Tax=Serinus canaria TaxID=9135 RepID=UPI0021CCFF77